MDFFETILARNAEFVDDGFDPNLKIIPSTKTMLLGCVDPRVDPTDILKLKPDEAAIIRNVGGRVNPSFFETMNILATVSKAAGQPVGEGWNLILLQHTDCGIRGCYRHAPDLLAKYMGVAPDALEPLAILDPYKAVEVDVAALRANPAMPGGFTVAGLVYDIATGKIETVVSPTRLRSPEPDVKD